MLLFARADVTAASLYLSPSSGTFTVGSTFTVSLFVNTGGQSVNAIHAALAFPPNKLQLVSPTTGKSLIQVWINAPSYSNMNGTIDLQGAIPTPGVNTDAGLVSTFTFRVMDTGTALVSIGSASKVLLNDGKGTDVLGQTSGGIYTLALPPPAGPIVTSPTEPDQNAWYSLKSASFQWVADSGADGYSYVLNQSPLDDPPDMSLGTARSIAYSNLADGVYYFHIKSRVNGVWGGVTDYAIHIDHTPPAAFDVGISPGTYTSNQNPIVTFLTTDQTSGVDHYELKIIPLSEPAAEAQGGNAQLFIEATSPYTQNLGIGDYDVVVRAYDAAGNYYQATTRLSVVNPFFEIIRSEGLRFMGSYLLPWSWAGIIALLLLIILFIIFVKLWQHHRRVEERIGKGALADPVIAKRLAELQEKQKTYGTTPPAAAMILAVFALAGLLGFARAVPAARAQNAPFTAVAAVAAPTGTTALALNPPLINLAPTAISSDEVLYLGGWANVPDASIVIYIERTETGETFSGVATTGSDGNWFYSFPQLLDAGHYVAWAQMKSGDTVSPPSSRVTVAVAPTALQVGSYRFDYQTLYLALFLLFLFLAFVLLVLIGYRTYHLRKMKSRLDILFREAEASLARGFAVLRRDIERELATIRAGVPEGGLSESERLREATLLHDLKEVNAHLGKDIWRLEEEERRL